MAFEGLALLSNGDVRAVSYTASYSGEPEYLTSARLLLGEADVFRRFADSLDQIGFRDMASPPKSSEAVEYLEVEDSQHGCHRVEWDAGSLAQLDSRLARLVCSLRAELLRQVMAVFSCDASETSRGGETRLGVQG